MNAPRCTCPTKFDDRSHEVVPGGLDQFCPLHGIGSHPVPHCPTCTCGVGAKIVQTPQTAAAAATGEKR